MVPIIFLSCLLGLLVFITWFSFTHPTKYTDGWVQAPSSVAADISIMWQEEELKTILQEDPTYIPFHISPQTEEWIGSMEEVKREDALILGRPKPTVQREHRIVNGHSIDTSPSYIHHTFDPPLRGVSSVDVVNEAYLRLTDAVKADRAENGPLNVVSDGEASRIESLRRKDAEARRDREEQASRIRQAEEDYRTYQQGQAHLIEEAVKRQAKCQEFSRIPQVYDPWDEEVERQEAQERIREEEFRRQKFEEARERIREKRDLEAQVEKTRQRIYQEVLHSGQVYHPWET